MSASWQLKQNSPPHTRTQTNLFVFRLNPFQTQPIAPGHPCWEAHHFGVAGKGLKAGLLDLGMLLVVFARDVPVSLLLGLLAMIKCSICSYMCDLLATPRQATPRRHATPRHPSPRHVNATPTPTPTPMQRQRQGQGHGMQRVTFARDVPVSLIFCLLVMIKCGICSYQFDPPRRLATPRHPSPRNANANANADADTEAEAEADADTTPMPMPTPSPTPMPRPRPTQRQRQRHADV
jgi:hypothetical protein